MMIIIGGAALLSLAAIVSAASGGAPLKASALTNSGGTPLEASASTNSGGGPLEGSAPTNGDGGGARSVVLSNVLPHTDAHGSIIDAHDGSIALLEGPRGREFYWYAMGYGYNIQTGKDDCPESGRAQQRASCSLCLLVPCLLVPCCASAACCHRPPLTKAGRRCGCS